MRQRPEREPRGAEVHRVRRPQCFAGKSLSFFTLIEYIYFHMTYTITKKTYIKVRRVSLTLVRDLPCNRKDPGNCKLNTIFLINYKFYFLKVIPIRCQTLTYANCFSILERLLSQLSQILFYAGSKKRQF